MFVRSGYDLPSEDGPGGDSDWGDHSDPAFFGFRLGRPRHFFGAASPFEIEDRPAANPPLSAPVAFTHQHLTAFLPLAQG